MISGVLVGVPSGRGSASRSDVECAGRHDTDDATSAINPSQVARAESRQDHRVFVGSRLIGDLVAQFYERPLPLLRHGRPRPRLWRSSVVWGLRLYAAEITWTRCWVKVLPCNREPLLSAPDVETKNCVRAE